MGGLYSHTYRATGTVLTQGIYNGDHQSHIDNQTPQMTDDYSTNAAQMQSTADPYPGSVESLASSLAGEVERIRYVIKQITGKDQWYQDPDQGLNDIIFNVKDSGATGDGVTDDSTAINSDITAANAAGGGIVLLPAGGTYLALSLVMKSNVRLVAHGATILKNAGAAGTHILNMTGAITATTTTLTVNGAIGDTALTVTSESGFAAGDYVLLYDATYAYGTSGRNQELNRVASTAANTITLQNRLIGAYAVASTATITKLTPISNASIEGGTWDVGSGQDGGGIYGVLCYGCTVRDLTVLHPDDDPGVFFEQSAYCKVENVTVRDGQTLASGGFGYGVAAGEASHHIEFVNVTTENVRENTLTDGAKFCTVRGGEIVGSYDTGWNTHGAGVRDSAIEGVTIVSPRLHGISVGYTTHNAGDARISILNNRIFSAGNHGISVASPVAGTLDNVGIIVRGNYIRNYGVTTASSRGIGVGYSDDVQITGNTIDGANHTNAAYGIYVTNAVDTLVGTNQVLNLGSGHGIEWNDVTSLIVQGNLVHDIATSNLISTGTNSVVLVANNVTDDDNQTKQAGEIWRGNVYGASDLEENEGAATTIADGGTITHGIGATPTIVRATGSVAGEIVSVTAIGAATFTVAIKTHAGAAGTAQTVYWYAKR